jgi:hypothetical protein
MTKLHKSEREQVSIFFNFRKLYTTNRQQIDYILFIPQYCRTLYTIKVRMQPAPTTLADQVFTQVQQAIVQGRFTPGQRLSEAELSRNFGCSRVPLREAIRRLESQGLITPHPSRRHPGCHPVCR